MRRARVLAPLPRFYGVARVCGETGILTDVERGGVASWFQRLDDVEALVVQRRLVDELEVERFELEQFCVCDARRAADLVRRPIAAASQPSRSLQLTALLSKLTRGEQGLAIEIGEVMCRQHPGIKRKMTDKKHAATTQGI